MKYYVGDKVLWRDRVCTILKSLPCHEVKILVPALPSEWSKSYTRVVQWQDIRPLTKLELALR